MFNSPSHLPHLLRPDQYWSEDQYAREIKHLFLPEWHFICTTGDLPRDGDFRTFEMFSRPVLIRNFAGQYQAFLNVCPHRFCRVSDIPQGHSDVFRCQYHGWEFECTGQTRRIPDATNFRPFRKGQAELTTIRTACIGQLIFLNFSSEGPSLEEWLGPICEELRSSVDQQWTQIMALQTGPEGNWKCVIENTLEDYHHAVAHEHTLGRFPHPDEEDWTNELVSDRMSVIRVKLRPGERRVSQRLEDFALKLMGRSPTRSYRHYHVYPGFGCICTDLFAIAQSVLPIAPNRHLNLYRLFIYRGTRTFLQRYYSWWVKHLAGRFLKSLWGRTFEEDNIIVRESQRGLESVLHPPGGVISRREELIFHFQNYVLQYGGSAEQLPTQHAPVVFSEASRAAACVEGDC